MQSRYSLSQTFHSAFNSDCTVLVVFNLGTFYSSFRLYSQDLLKQQWSGKSFPNCHWQLLDLARNYMVPLLQQTLAKVTHPFQLQLGPAIKRTLAASFYVHLLKTGHALFPALEHTSSQAESWQFSSFAQPVCEN